MWPRRQMQDRREAGLGGADGVLPGNQIRYANRPCSSLDVDNRRPASTRP